MISLRVAHGSALEHIDKCAERGRFASPSRQGSFGTSASPGVPARQPWSKLAKHRGTPRLDVSSSGLDQNIPMTMLSARAHRPGPSLPRRLTMEVVLQERDAVHALLVIEEHLSGKALFPGTPDDHVGSGFSSPRCPT